MTLRNCKKNCRVVNNQIEFYAMMRSGQHAIIHWLFHQIREPIYFHNDILCHGDDRAFLDRGRWINVKKKAPIRTFPWYSFNVEDISIKNINKVKTKYKKALYIVKPKKEIKVLIIRDPFNLFASRYRFFYRMNTVRKEDGRKLVKINGITNANSEISWFDKKAAERWKEYAREALGQTSFLGKNKIIINYNLWFKSKQYRQKISNKLGVSFSDAKLNFVPKNGFGSSFDVRTMDKKAQKMDVLNRWRHFEKDKQFENIFSDKEMLLLSSKLYPKITELASQGLRL